jgi:hypothetical protein
MRHRRSVVADRKYDRESHSLTFDVHLHHPVIPSEEDRSLVNDLRSRGTCFCNRPFKSSEKTAGLSTVRINSHASRFASLEMTVQGKRMPTAEADRLYKESKSQVGQHA